MPCKLHSKQRAHTITWNKSKTLCTMKIQQWDKSAQLQGSFKIEQFGEWNALEKKCISGRRRGCGAGHTWARTWFCCSLPLWFWVHHVAALALCFPLSKKGCCALSTRLSQHNTQNECNNVGKTASLECWVDLDSDWEDFVQDRFWQFSSLRKFLQALSFLEISGIGLTTLTKDQYCCTFKCFYKLYIPSKVGCYSITMLFQCC